MHLPAGGEQPVRLTPGKIGRPRPRFVARKGSARPIPLSLHDAQPAADAPSSQAVPTQAPPAQQEVSTDAPSLSLPPTPLLSADLLPGPTTFDHSYQSLLLEQERQQQQQQQHSNALQEHMQLQAQAQQQEQEQHAVEMDVEPWQDCVENLGLPDSGLVFSKAGGGIAAAEESVVVAASAACSEAPESEQMEKDPDVEGSGRQESMAAVTGEPLHSGFCSKIASLISRWRVGSGKGYIPEAESAATEEAGSIKEEEAAAEPAAARPAVAEPAAAAAPPPPLAAPESPAMICALQMFQVIAFCTKHLAQPPPPPLLVNSLLTCFEAGDLPASYARVEDIVRSQWLQVRFVCL